MPSAETLVRELVAELIGLPAHDVDLSRRFAELGVESLAALRLRRLVAARTGVELPLTSFLGDRPAQDVLAALENAVVPDRPAVAVVPSVSPGDAVGLTA